jgi:DNA-binding HxlR family transcriptional regulator
MKTQTATGESCATTMKLLGDFWTLRIIDALKMDEVRFCELQRTLDNVNPVTLTKRLKTLEDARLVVRSEETVDKISVTYALSDLGQETVPIITALNRFSEKSKSY